MSAGSNVVSVAEHVVMLILSLVRNFLPAHQQIKEGGWDIGAAASKAYDLENKVVGTVGTGQIGQLVLERLKVSCCDTSCRHSFGCLIILTYQFSRSCIQPVVSGYFVHAPTDSFMYPFLQVIQSLSDNACHIYHPLVQKFKQHFTALMHFPHLCMQEVKPMSITPAEC